MNCKLLMFLYWCKTVKLCFIVQIFTNCMMPLWPLFLWTGSDVCFKYVYTPTSIDWGLTVCLYINLVCKPYPWVQLFYLYKVQHLYLVFIFVLSAIFRWHQCWTHCTGIPSLGTWCFTNSFVFDLFHLYSCLSFLFFDISKQIDLVWKESTAQLSLYVNDLNGTGFGSREMTF